MLRKHMKSQPAKMAHCEIKSHMSWPTVNAQKKGENSQEYSPI